MFPITVTLHNQTQLAAVLAALAEPSPQQSLPLGDPKPKKAEKPVKLNAEQEAAVDDTAGLGNDAKTAGTKPTVAAVKADAPAPKAVSYADLQAAVLKLHKLDPTAAKPIATAMGYENFKAMPEDKWPEALEKVQEALNERGV